MKKKMKSNFLLNLDNKIKSFSNSQKYNRAVEAFYQFVPKHSAALRAIIEVGELSEMCASTFKSMLQDKRFSKQELLYIGEVYFSILKNSHDLMNDFEEYIRDYADEIEDEAVHYHMYRIINKMNLFYQVGKLVTAKFLSVSFFRSIVNGDVNDFLMLHKNYQPETVY